MKKLLFVLVTACVFCTPAPALEIAISTQAGWWPQAAADTEMAKIVANVKAVPVKLFAATDQAALATWVKAHTGDGVPDLLILCGNFPATIYAPGNTQPNGSLAELFLDDGNTIINTGDYIFYVVDGAGTNAAGGLQNMMDLPTIAMWGDGGPACVPTADGKKYTPTLPTVPSTRPFFFSDLTGDWYPELILAQAADGSRGDPVIARNRVTGGRVGIFFQVADVLTDVRGQVISDWINNWYLPHAVVKTSSNPSPADGATDVPRDTMLSWKASGSAAHDVYFGTTFADVNSASRTAPGSLASQGQTAATFDPPGSLAYGTTYYWRVDEVNQTDGTIAQGSVWSFTVEPYGYPLTKVTATASTFQPGMGPENTVNGSGLTGNQHSTKESTQWLSTGALPNWIQFQFDAVYKLDRMLVWNSNESLELFLGFGAKDVTVEYSADGTAWTTLAGVPPFAQATGLDTYTANTTVNFGGVSAQFVKLTINKTWGGMSTIAGLSEVQFSYVPVLARSPQPANGATGVALNTSLSWRPGREAGSHQVFLGADQAAVAAGTAAAQTVTEHSFTPGSLNYGTKYYWRVDEVNTVTYPGDVWTFTTLPYAVVDDFESYDEDANRLYDTWIDGSTDGQSNSYVGYNPTAAELAAGTGHFAERTIVHGGSQSMPMAYDNTKAPFLSEATRTFATAQDLAGNGASYLTVWFRGRAPAFADNGDGTYTMSSSGSDIWNNGDQFRFVYKQLSGDGSMVVRVDSVVNTNAWAKAGVMIRQSIEAGSTHAFMPITAGGSGAGNGASFQRRLVANGASSNDDKPAPAIGAPYWVKIDRKGSSFSGSISPDGKTWTQIGAAQTINMTNPVLIGFALCSHDAALTTVAQFSNMSMTGTVTGSWQVAAIGMAMPTNDAAGLYAVVEDSVGVKKVVTHPNPAATSTPAWTLWPISIGDLKAAGVKMNQVKKLTIGVGDKNSPKAGGTGMLFLDDLGFGTPVTAVPGSQLDITLAASTDDMEEYVASGSISGTSSDLELAYENSVAPANEQIVGLRYYLPLAQGAVISKAYVQFNIDELTLGTQPVNLIIEGQLIPNAPAFTTTARDISSRTGRTQAQVKWAVENWVAPGGQTGHVSSLGLKSQTADLTPILQELVNQGAWFSGNAIVLIFSDDKSNPSQGLRCADAYEDGAAYAPVLHVELAP